MGSKKRTIVQLITTIASNSYIKGFQNGTIFKGKSKQFCVPGLNCYSCPGALGSCPIGSLQAVLGSLRFQFSFYIIGTISFLGIIFGRLICGWICPFGFFQELLHKIPVRKFNLNEKIHKYLKYFKYAILIVFVILLPLFWVDDIGMGEPYFCKFICPAGTLEGGIPLVILNESLRSVIGFLYAWKISILIAIIVLSIIMFRPFCKYICPLGALYGLFNNISFYSINVDKNKCNSCKACNRTCKMNVKIIEKRNFSECIRCGECVKVCKNSAIVCGFNKELKKKRKKLIRLHEAANRDITMN